MGQFQGEWGEYNYDTSGGNFMKEDEVILAIALGKVFIITAVRDDDSNTYNNKPKPRFLVDLIDDQGEEHTRGFGKGIPARDARMQAFRKQIEETGEPIEGVRFIKGGSNGKAFDITGA